MRRPGTSAKSPTSDPTETLSNEQPHANKQDQTPEEFDQRLSRLAPTIREVAQRVARRFRGQVACDIQEQAISHVGLALKLSNSAPEPGNEEPWLYAVLYHFGQDERRRRTRGDPLNFARTGAYGQRNGQTFSALENTAGPQETLETREELAAQTQQILARQVRECIERLEGKARPKGVDYMSVLLLDIRIRCAAQIIQSYENEPPVEFAPLLDHVERLFPWSKEESSQSPREFLPPLCALWECVRADTCARGAVCDGRRFAKVIAHKFIAAGDADAGSGPNTAAAAKMTLQWHQWTHRARGKLQKCVSPQEWRRLFEGLFGPWRENHEHES